MQMLLYNIYIHTSDLGWNRLEWNGCVVSLWAMSTCAPKGLAYRQWTIYLCFPNLHSNSLALFQCLMCIAQPNHTRGAERNRKWVKWNGSNFISPRISMTFLAHTHKVPLNIHMRQSFLSIQKYAKTHETCSAVSFHCVWKGFVRFLHRFILWLTPHSQSHMSGVFVWFVTAVAFRWTELVQFLNHSSAQQVQRAHK